MNLTVDSVSSVDIPALVAVRHDENRDAKMMTLEELSSKTVCAKSDDCLWK